MIDTTKLQAENARYQSKLARQASDINRLQTSLSNSRAEVARLKGGANGITFDGISILSTDAELDDLLTLHEGIASRIRREIELRVYKREAA